MTPETLVVATGCRRAAAETFAGPLSRAIIAWGIRGERARALFIANCAHESALFTRLEENLSYSASAMMRVWPSRFPTEQHASLFVRRPEALANHVYSGRMGNVAPGDGWRYRGRGLIQLTGRSNYTAYAKASGVPADIEPALLIDPEFAADSAGWYWREHKLNDVHDPLEVTRIINGGETGHPERVALFELASKAGLGEDLA